MESQNHAITFDIGRENHYGVVRVERLNNSSAIIEKHNICSLA